MSFNVFLTIEKSVYTALDNIAILSLLNKLKNNETSSLSYDYNRYEAKWGLDRQLEAVWIHIDRAQIILTCLDSSNKSHCTSDQDELYVHLSIVAIEPKIEILFIWIVCYELKCKYL